MWYFFGGFTGTLALLMILDSKYSKESQNERFSDNAYRCPYC
jgi:hypothetical protein